MTDEQLINDFNGLTRINRHITEKVSTDPHYRDYILTRFSDTQNVSEILYRIKHHIESNPLCPISGRPVKFVNFQKGYRETYSVSCAKQLIKAVPDIDDPAIMLTDLIKDHKLNTNKLQDKYLKEHGYFNYLENIHTDAVSRAEKLYRLYYGIDRSKCKECGKPALFLNFDEGYYDFCGKDCPERYAYRFKEITDEIVINLIMQNGELNSSRLEQSFLENWHIADYFKNRFSDGSKNNTEIFYRILNKIEETPKCPICGRPAKFIKFKIGYAVTCEDISCSRKYLASHEKENSQISDEYIKDNYLLDGISANINGGKFKKELLHHDGTYSYLVNRFEDTDNPREAAYRIVHEIKEKPKCEICGQPKKFRNIKIGYPEFCSSTCIATKVRRDKYRELGFDADNERHGFLKIKNDCKKHPEYVISKKMFNSRLDSGEQMCPYCNPKKITEIEQIVIDILEKYKIKYVIHDRTQIYPLELDLFLPDYNLAIECNGIFWHQEKRVGDKQFEKFKICKDKNIRLLQFWENDIKEKTDIVETFILNACGLVKAYCGKLTVKEARDDSFVKRHSLGNKRGNMNKHIYRGLLLIGNISYDENYIYDLSVIYGESFEIFRNFIDRPLYLENDIAESYWKIITSEVKCLQSGQIVRNGYICRNSGYSIFV